MIFNKKGFAIIELMIVTTIIGILMTIGMLQYQHFIIKSQVGRVISEVGELRLSVEECINTGRMVIGTDRQECDPRATGSNLVVGRSQVDMPLSENLGVAQFDNPLTSTTNIIATISQNANPTIRSKKVIWRRNSNGFWNCLTNIEQRYIANTCTYTVF
ncbi:hypothetical protein A9Z61_12050 [Moraxella osloensis]|nr:pilin [Moraxella osloensis]OBX56302.1 hypothetical protein A9Z61_12050 [Moraxella osloensis]